eukprot:m.34920 g.34920  ORF g.34920 m.34920 type:complete len:167 (-) comp8803_c0_seq3:1690-2190(-)
MIQCILIYQFHEKKHFIFRKRKALYKLIEFCFDLPRAGIRSHVRLCQCHKLQKEFFFDVSIIRVVSEIFVFIIVKGHWSYACVPNMRVQLCCNRFIPEWTKTSAIPNNPLCNRHVGSAHLIPHIVDVCSVGPVAITHTHERVGVVAFITRAFSGVVSVVLPASWKL